MKYIESMDKNLEFGISFFVTFFCHITAWLASCDWWRKPKYPAKTTAYLKVTGNLLTYGGPDSNQGSGERQRAVSGNALYVDHTAIRASPTRTVGLWIRKNTCCIKANLHDITCRGWDSNPDSSDMKVWKRKSTCCIRTNLHDILAFYDSSS